MDEYSLSIREELNKVSFPELIYNIFEKKLSGVIEVKRDDEEKGFIIKKGQIVFSKTNNIEESLGSLLLQKGLITKEQYSSSVLIMQETGKRQGRILVEMNAIKPSDLWEGVKEQLKQIFFSIFNWAAGEFSFNEGDPTITEAIVLTESTPDLILEGVRGVSDFNVFYHYISDRSIRYVINDEKYKRRPIVMEPYEEYVTDLVNGERSVEEIINLSDIGEIETLRVLYILKIFKLIVSDKNYTIITPVPLKNAEKDDFVKLIDKFNNVFSYIYHTVLREVGPIGERIIEKNIGEVTLYRGDVFSKITLSKNGIFDPDELLKALWTVRKDKRKKILAKFLDDLLLAETLAVKRVLGKEFEDKVIAMVKDIKEGV